MGGSCSRWVSSSPWSCTQIWYNLTRGALASGPLRPAVRLHLPSVRANSRGRSSPRETSKLWFAQCALLLATLPTACDKQLEVAVCLTPESAAPDGGLTATGFVFPWSTGFENGFCGYSHPGGFCLHSGSATSEIVTSPVHSGNFAAAYTTNSDPANPGNQTRCVRQGTFPASAYYGAWYYVPSARIASGTWNLLHFSGNDTPTGPTRGLWDVSLVQIDTDQLRIWVDDLIDGNVNPDLSAAPPIPIDTWFHLKFYYKRASDATGEIILYQDDQVVLHLTALVTDNSNWGQWYVGSYSTGLSPSKTTVYVDDVSLSPDP